MIKHFIITNIMLFSIYKIYKSVLIASKSLDGFTKDTL